MEKLINYFKQLLAKVRGVKKVTTSTTTGVTVAEILNTTTFLHTFDAKPQLDVKDGEFVVKEATAVEAQKERDAKTRKRKYYSNKPANDSRGKSKKGSVAKANA